MLPQIQTHVDPFELAFAALCLYGVLVIARLPWSDREIEDVDQNAHRLWARLRRVICRR